ncbi:MAG: hypothetical protein V7603_3947 [Micromonosporaceae bacterium]|jgi:hypothetical protein
MDVWVVREDSGYRWLLAGGSGRDGSERDDPVARAATVAADEASCRASAVALTEAPGEAIVCVQQADGGWRWQLAAADGAPLAESALAYPDAPTCRVSALAMQRILAGRLREACAVTGAYAVTGG